MNLKNLPTWAKISAIIVGIALVFVAALAATYLAVSTANEPAPLIKQNTDDRLIEDDYEDEITKVMKTLTKPGSVIEQGQTGHTTLGRDVRTNRPNVGDVKLDNVQEVDPSNIGPLKLEGPLLGEYNARFWYVTATITVDERPSPDTRIPFPLALDNARNPPDENGVRVFDPKNPDCLLGPERWGDAKSNTVTKCQVLITFDGEEPSDIFLLYNAIDLNEHPELYKKLTTYKFEAKPIKEA